MVDMMYINTLCDSLYNTDHISMMDQEGTPSNDSSSGDGDPNDLSSFDRAGMICYTIQCIIFRV